MKIEKDKYLFIKKISVERWKEPQDIYLIDIIKVWHKCMEDHENNSNIE